MADCHVAWCDIPEDHDHHGHPECAGKPCAPGSHVADDAWDGDYHGPEPTYDNQCW
ncbi:hypothetical protein [Mycobacterium phage WXIN]|nr:hypothetical protein [Mycobacterium phage WXIN]